MFVPHFMVGLIHPIAETFHSKQMVQEEKSVNRSPKSVE